MATREASEVDAAVNLEETMAAEEATEDVEEGVKAVDEEEGEVLE